MKVETSMDQVLVVYLDPDACASYFLPSDSLSVYLLWGLH